MKEEALLSCGWHDKKTSDFFQGFLVQPIPRDLGFAPPYQQQAGFLTERSPPVISFPEQKLQWLVQSTLMRTPLSQ